MSEAQYVPDWAACGHNNHWKVHNHIEQEGVCPLCEIVRLNLQNRDFQERISAAEKVARKHWDAHPGFAVFVLQALKKCTHQKIEAVGEGFRKCVKCGEMEPPYPEKTNQEKRVEQSPKKCDSYWDGNQCEDIQGHEGKHRFMGWTWVVSPPPMLCNPCSAHDRAKDAGCLCPCHKAKD